MAEPNFEPDVMMCDSYLSLYSLEYEEWESSSYEKQMRTMNVAYTTLKRKYPDFIIPEDAVYAFTGVLSALFSDANKGQHYGVAGYSVTGVASYTFNQSSVGQSLERFIPAESKRLIEEVNGVSLKRKFGRTI
ncbi:hypothetical protein V7138_14955 [Bacillus sp. JJ1533]|uniref:hypothetical protein n=1 Tax=Bacillus sp. JJ1533 TaxID=3122959 RepID=UPI002FFD9109